MEKQKADAIITEYLPKIYGFAMKKSFSYDEAEDLCSDILQEVYRSLLKSEEIINLEGYIWRISEHTYSKYVSYKKKHMGVSIDGLEIPYEEDFPLEDSEEEIRHLRREIAFLTKKRREIVYAFYYENKAISLISKETGIPEGTVKWHLNKARNELKEAFSMKRILGKLGLYPIKSISIGHHGSPGAKGGPEHYLNDKLNLNIVYSVYHTPKTLEEIAEELGMTPVFIEDRIDYLEGNGFLVRCPGDRFTTYVVFNPQTYSKELSEQHYKRQMEAANLLVQEYIPLVQEAVADMQEVYIPGGNRELLLATAIFYGIIHKCYLSIDKDLSKYYIKPTDGGDYIARVEIPSKPSDPDYKQGKSPRHWSCGPMTRDSAKYPAIYSWSIDSDFSSREGYWQNNHGYDYEYLYELITGNLADNLANQEKFQRLKARNFITDDNKVNIMVMKGKQEDFYKKIPSLDEQIKKKFADYALESAMMVAKDYPPQIQDFIISKEVEMFINTNVAFIVMDILYSNGTLQPLTENEKVTFNLIMFSDVLPRD